MDADVRWWMWLLAPFAVVGAALFYLGRAALFILVVTLVPLLGLAVLAWVFKAVMGLTG